MLLQLLFDKLILLFWETFFLWAFVNSNFLGVCFLLIHKLTITWLIKIINGKWFHLIITYAIDFISKTFCINYLGAKIKLNLYNNCQLSLNKLMRPLQSKYHNSSRHSDDEDIATLRTLVAQLIAEKDQPSSSENRKDQHLNQLRSEN